ncbi:MAG: hypothetical protein ACFFCW_37595, partial [Candidatus Hodarchaeota archaeon]
MLNRRNVVIFAILNTVMIVVLLSQIWRFAKEIKEYESILADVQEKRLKNEEYLTDLGKIKDIIDDSSNSSTEIIKKTAEFVHDNSLHLTDQEYHQHVGGTSATVLPVVIKKLLLAYQGDESKKPHIACGLRSYAMRAILERFDIYSRLVHIYSDEYEDPQGHRLLEVLNPDTRAWELWDPDFKVNYVYRDSKKPVDIMALVLGDRDKIIPKNGPIEGWEETKTKHLKDNFFEAVMFENIFHDMPGNVIIINRKRFDIHRIFSNGMTFTEFATKVYQHPRLILLPI